MIWTGINHETFLRFPELEATALDKFNYFDDEEPGSFLIFEDIFLPLIEKCAKQGSQAELQGYMTFLEEIADHDFGGLIQIGLGESLIDSKLRDTIYSYAGPLTRRELDIAERKHIRNLRDRESRPLLDLARNLLAKRKKEKPC